MTIYFPELTGTVIPMLHGYGFRPHSTYHQSVSSDSVTNYEAYPAGFRLDLYTFPNEPRWITNVIPIDFNHDGFMDIVATGQVTNQGTSPVPAFAYVNDGTGRFTEVSSQVLGGFKTWGLSFWAVRDFDGDGYDDLFIANVGMDEPPWTGGGHFLLMGSAEGTLIDEGAARVPGPREVASWGDAGDIDGDGDIDILTCGTGGMCNLLINDGTGHFNYDDFRMPPPAIEPPGFRSTNGQLLDVDQDGDLDIFFGLSITYGIRDVLLINDGSGYFKRAPEASLPVRRFAGNGYSTGISTKGDLNGDGHPDILVALINHTTPSPQYNQLLLNRGDGTFEDASSRLWQDGAGSLGWNSHQIADFNCDGWADLLMLVIGSLLHINRGGLFFEDVHDRVTPGAPNSWHGYSAAVDVNNDGSMDIISSFPELFRLAVYVNILPYGIPEPPLPKPEAPDLISPANGEALSTIEASLRWSTVTGASGYRLQVAGNLDFSQIVLGRSDLTSGAFQLRGLQGNQTYLWRVRAINTRGEGPWSDGRFFTTRDTRMISGDVSYQGNPLQGVRMMDLPGQPVTDAAGHYETRVEAGWSGTARPYKANYNFVPETSTYSNVVTDRETDCIAYIGIPQHERRALIAFYQSTGGDGWTNKIGWKEPPLEAGGFATYGSEGNWFGVTVDIMYPSQIFSVTVAELVLTANNLQGMFPAELGALSNLRRLEANGAIGGSLPASMASLKKLCRLAIKDTDLEGSIPAWLGNNLDLVTLKLARNRLTGTIPPEPGNCVNLQRLYIQKNAILGPIPPEIMNLSLLNEGSIDENALFANDPAAENFIKSHLGQMSAQTLARTNLAAEAKSPSSIELTWSTGSYLSGYRIHYSTSKGGPYVLYGTAGDWESSRLITGLESGRTYYFVMQSYADPNPGQGQKNSVVSAFSAEVWAVTPGLTPKADDIVADFGTAGLWLWSAGV